MNRLISSVAACAIVACGFAPARAADLAAAKQNYDTFCASCHGTGGNGDGPGAATLATNPRNFTDCAAMDKSSHGTMGKNSNGTMAKVSHDTMMFKVIKDGGAAAGLSKDMPGWSSGFEDGEIRDLVTYIKTFCKN